MLTGIRACSTFLDCYDTIKTLKNFNHYNHSSRPYLVAYLANAIFLIFSNTFAKISPCILICSQITAIILGVKAGYESENVRIGTIAISRLFPLAYTAGALLLPTAFSPGVVLACAAMELAMKTYVTNESNRYTPPRNWLHDTVYFNDIECPSVVN